MGTSDDTFTREVPGRGNRRAFMRLMAGGSLAIAAPLAAGCAGMKADPKRPRPKTHITGRGGANGK